MAINSTHPVYDAYLPDWCLMRDCYAGERVVKAKGIIYLPPTPAQEIDGMGGTKPGQKAYDAYKMRAVFHDYVSEAVEAYIGLLHEKPANFELPDAMMGLMEKATNNGESLQMLLRSINEQQLVTGRLGLLLDFPVTPDPTNPMPYVTMYVAEAIQNWDDSNDKQDLNNLNLVVLNESSYERLPSLDWKQVEKYRVLMLADPNGTGAELPSANAIYHNGVFRMDGAGVNMPIPADMVVPTFRGQTLNMIPFVMVNSKDIVASPDKPPLLGLGRLSMTIYRMEADYRFQLFMQGQDTLVVIGGLIESADPAQEVRVGAGAKLEVQQGGDAKYIGVESSGLGEVRSALEADKNRAVTKAGQLATKMGGQKESGEALNTRLGAQTATLRQVALTGAGALEKVLKMAAVWMGQDPEKVKVTPNLEFNDLEVDGKMIVDLVTARTMGAPLSYESIHAVMVQRGITEKTFEEEQELVDEEDAGRISKQKKLGIGPTGLPIEDPNNPSNQPGNSSKAE